MTVLDKHLIRGFSVATTVRLPIIRSVRLRQLLLLEEIHLACYRRAIYVAAFRHFAGRNGVVANSAGNQSNDCSGSDFDSVWRKASKGELRNNVNPVEMRQTITTQ